MARRDPGGQPLLDLRDGLRALQVQRQLALADLAQVDVAVGCASTAV
jgi:hypothetical protein